MEIIPSPPEFILDANDDNLLFSIPDEPVEIEETKNKETPNDASATKKKKSELYVTISNFVKSNF